MSIDVAIQKLISNKTDIRKFSNSNADIAVTITYSEQGRSQTLVLDTVDDVNVRSSSTLTQHPIVDGSMVADHMFENPTQISITGLFPLEGNKKQNIERTTTGSQLANVEDLFERLKREGIRCEIVKISSIDQQIRFLRRSNMVLTNITWNENINTLGYSFTFVEAQTVEVKVANITQADEDVPNILYPSTVSFSEAIADPSYVIYTILQFLKQKNVITDRFMNYVASFGSDALKKKGFSTTESIATATATKKSSTKVTASIAENQIGKGEALISIAKKAVKVAVPIAISCIGAISKLITGKKQLIRIYDHTGNAIQDAQDLKDFVHLCGQIYSAVQELDENIHVYQVSYNGDQECLVTLDNSYYSFIFKKNNITDKYALTVYNFDNDPDGEKVAEVYDVNSRALSAYNECFMNNSLFRTSFTKQYVHLLCNSNRNDLTNYFIIASEIYPPAYTEKIIEAVDDLIRQ